MAAPRLFRITCNGRESSPAKDPRETHCCGRGGGACSMAAGSAASGVSVSAVGAGDGRVSAGGILASSSGTRSEGRGALPASRSAGRGGLSSWTKAKWPKITLIASTRKRTKRFSTVSKSSASLRFRPPDCRDALRKSKAHVWCNCRGRRALESWVVTCTRGFVGWDSVPTRSARRANHLVAAPGRVSGAGVRCPRRHSGVRFGILQSPNTVLRLSALPAGGRPGSCPVQELRRSFRSCVPTDSSHGGTPPNRREPPHNWPADCRPAVDRHCPR